ncbi:methyl-accepting chemotaxis protein [Zooshikella sp. RANM57]|uniref:methyl-accepting chemotaxis protein n=1 Tax=Zooshikella sp. RANM57 TaxID=3425863 RepID=UPI003D6E9206
MDVRIGIAVKLTFIFLLFALTTIALQVYSYYHQYQQMTLQRALQVKTLVESVHAISNYYYQQRTTQGEEQAKQNALSAIRAMRYGQGNYFWINDTRNRMVMHPLNSELQGQDMSNLKDPDGIAMVAEATRVALAGGDWFEYKWHRAGEGEQFFPKISYAQLFEPWGWVIGTGEYIDDIRNEFWSSVRVNGIAFGVLLVLVMAGSLWWVRRITQPVTEMVKVMKAVEQGDLRQQMATQTQDEIGVLTESFNRVVRSLQKMIGSLYQSVETLLTEANALRQESKATSDALSAHDREVEQLVAAMQELQTTAQDVAKNASLTADRTSQVVNAVGGGEQYVGQLQQHSQTLAHELVDVSSAISQLDENMQKIAEFIHEINEISAQTNLLALNAAIEAARAGEKGRGFAVVADEVRSLASRTQDSTQLIQELISGFKNCLSSVVVAMNDNRQRSEQGVEHAVQTQNVFNTVVQDVQDVDSMNTQVATAAEEQVNVISEMNSNLERIQQEASTSAENADKAFTHSENVDQQALMIQQQLARYQIG